MEEKNQNQNAEPQQAVKDNEESTFTIGKVFKAIGWITIASGIIIGLLMDSYLHDYSSDTNFLYILKSAVAGAISGLLFIGFGEVIDLLKSIDQKLGKK